MPEVYETTDEYLDRIAYEERQRDEHYFQEFMKQPEEQRWRYVYDLIQREESK